MTKQRRVGHSIKNFRHMPTALDMHRQSLQQKLRELEIDVRELQEWPLARTALREG